MNKDTISKHYNLDLDSLFAGNGNSSSSRMAPVLPKRRQQTVPWPSNNNTSLAINRPSSPAHTLANNGTGAMIPPTTAPRNQLNRGLAEVTSSNSHRRSALDDLEDIFNSDSTSSLEQSLPMPTTQAPTLPVPPPVPPSVPPPVPARNLPGTGLQIKRVSTTTPNADLLDLRNGVTLPEVSFFIIL